MPSRAAGRRAGRLVASVLGVVAALAMNPSAQAYDGPGCAQRWNVPNDPDRGPSGTVRCTILPAGTPIDLSGTASAATTFVGDASIRVWLSPSGSPEVVLAECTDSGDTNASCGTQLTAIVVDVRVSPFPGGTGPTLQCNMSWTGNLAGDGGCFGPKNCRQIGELGVYVLGERQDPPACQDP